METDVKMLVTFRVDCKRAFSADTRILDGRITSEAETGGTRLDDEISRRSEFSERRIVNTDIIVCFWLERVLLSAVLLLILGGLSPVVLIILDGTTCLSKGTRDLVV